MVEMNSAYDRVKEHLDRHGAETPVSPELRGDLETLLRRADEIADLGEEFGSVELSPFMKSLLRVSGLRKVSDKRREKTVAVGA